MTLGTRAWGHDGLTGYNGKDMRAFIEGLAGHNGIATTPGVLHGLKVAAQGSPNTTVAVAAGKAVIAATGSGLGFDYHVWNDASINSTGFTATSGNGRKDRLILRVTSGVPALEIVQGTASGSPVEPSITGDNYLELALVTMPASTTNITNAMITDRRVFIGRWAQAWGYINSVSAMTTTNSASASFVAVTGSNLAFTAVAGRRYKYTVIGHTYVNPAGATSVAPVAITDTGGSQKGVPSRFDTFPATANTVAAFIHGTAIESFTSVTAGAVTRQLRVAGIAGGNGAFFVDGASGRDALFMVEDIGPAGAPD